MAKAYDPDMGMAYGPYDFLLPMMGNVVEALAHNNNVPKEYVERTQIEWDKLNAAYKAARENDELAQANYDLEQAVNTLVSNMCQDTKSCPKYALYTEYFLMQRVPCGKSSPDYPELDYPEETVTAVQHAIRQVYGKNRGVEVAMRHRFLI